MAGTHGLQGAVPASVVVELLDAAAERQEHGADVTRLLSRAGVPAADVAEISSAVHRLQISSDRWRRRGQELSALYSTARELAQLRDVDELLDRLVERAHDLVGTDVTYLSEFDVDSKELRVRTTLGTTAPSFLGLRVPPGMGLASMVVESRAPHWTSLYAGMTQAPHDAEIDAAVRAEGLVSLLGVPLLAGDEVIGVLFAANRVEHAFSPEEISLLSAFADHAAVVLQTARLLARTRASVEETRRAYAELARHVEAMERASGVHSDLTAIVLQGGDAGDVAVALGRALQCRVRILDPELSVVADTAETGSGDIPRRTSVRQAVERSRHSGRCVRVEVNDPDGRERGAHAGPAVSVAVAIVAGSSLLGGLLLDQGTVDFGPVEFRTAERAAQITALLSLKQDAVLEAEQRVRGDLLTDVLTDRPDRAADAVARARRRGIRIDDVRSTVVVAVATDHRRQAARAALRAVDPGGLVGEHDGHLVALTHVEDPGDAARHLHAAVSRALGVPVLAVGACIEDVLSEVRPRVDAAVACARILPVIGLADAAVTADEYLPYTALFGPGEARVASFVRSVVGPVLDWDTEHSRTLMPTLSAYLTHRLSPVATARALHVHKNTVLQRLDRVGELLGGDWQQPERLFRLGIALRLADLSSPRR